MLGGVACKVRDIKEVRNITGWGIEEATVFVESQPWTQYHESGCR